MEETEEVTQATEEAELAEGFQIDWESLPGRCEVTYSGVAGEYQCERFGDHPDDVHACRDRNYTVIWSLSSPGHVSMIPDKS